MDVCIAKCVRAWVCVQQFETFGLQPLSNGLIMAAQDYGAE